MSRRPLPLGSWGKVRVRPAVTDESGRILRWKAIALFRDLDGVSRPVVRWGRTQAAAETALRAALQERSRSGGSGTLSGVDRFSKAAQLWMQAVEAKVAAGTRSPGTAETYRLVLARHVLPALGDVRIGEMSPPLLDRLLGGIARRIGVPTARTSRSVISGVLGFAVRYGALAANPVRDVERLEGGPRREPRALSAEERLELFAALEGDAEACRRDLPALTRFLLGTGLRLGECLAVLWLEVGMDGDRVDVSSTVIRVRGQGLLCKSTKSRAGVRRLVLPAWLAIELRSRRSMGGVQLKCPVFPDALGGLRDPSNTRRALRRAVDRAGFSWVTSHNFRKTTATVLDEAGLSARIIADQLGHARPSMTQDVYMGRGVVDLRAAAALDAVMADLEKR